MLFQHYTQFKLIEKENEIAHPVIEFHLHSSIDQSTRNMVVREGALDFNTEYNGILLFGLQQLLYLSES